MDVIGFAQLAEVLADWPHSQIPAEQFVVSCHERLRQALLSLRADQESVGRGDLAGLIRHMLLREALLSPEVSPMIRVPRVRGWPSDAEWRDFGVDVVSKPDQSFLLRIQTTWSPDWLHGSRLRDPLLASFREDVRQQKRTAGTSFLLDPCVGQLLGEGFSEYTCPGQQQAIHAAFLMSPGGTLVVNLPTGSGKSLAVWAPALATAAGGGAAVTIVVVPTIALALDQERQIQKIATASSMDYMRQRLPNRLAYHSGLSAEDKLQFKNRIRDGSQVVVFTSPESIVKSLAISLYDAATAGYLRYFAVDEAHLIAQWGNEFRPEFQSMAGIRNDLLRCCPTDCRFRTLLLTATLTEETLSTLQTLFGDSEFEIVSAVHLRPEPEYWISLAETSYEQQNRVLDLVRRVPRPFLLYATRRDAAEDWTRRMKSLGIRRVACFHGKTDNAMRERILDQWRAGEIDAVVATSAFGLGVDKADVRAVIHACVPETLDRFYQEVGRGGRDGRACTPILVYTDETSRGPNGELLVKNDVKTARGLSQDRIISVEKGLPRWQSMYRRAIVSQKESSEYLVLDLNSKPPLVAADGTSNIAWNLRTLVLLARAHVIRIASNPPPRLEHLEGESDAEFQTRRDVASLRYFQSCAVQILEHRHLEETFWWERVETTRLAGYSADSVGFKMLEDMLRNRRELSTLLRELYSFRAGDITSDPIPVCAGCPSCREDGIDRSNYSLPLPDRLRYLPTSLSPRLAETFGTNTTFVSVAYPRPDSTQRGKREWRRNLLKFVCAPLVRMGIREFCVPDNWREEREYRDLHRHSSDRFVIHRPEDDFDERRIQAGVPRVTILDPDRPIAPIPQPLFLIDRPWHMVIAPDDLPDAHASGSYFDRADFIRYDNLLLKLNS